MNAPYLGDEISPAAEAPSFGLLDIVQFIKLHRWIILGAAGLIMVVTLITLILLTSLYTSTSTVMLDQRQTRVTTFQDVLSALPNDTAAIQNEAEVLQARAIAEAVVAKLHLMNDPEFNAARLPPSFATWVMGMLNKAKAEISALAGVPPLTPAQAARAEHDATVDAFMKMVDIEAQGVSTTIEINISSQSGEKAKRLADTMADLYLASQLDFKFEATKKVTQWLSDRLAGLAAQASSDEAKVAAYKTENHLTDLSTDKGGSVLDQQLSDLTTQLILTRTNSAEAEARLKEMEQLRASGHGADVTQVVANPLITNLREQEADLARQAAQLSATYGPRHPKILDIQSQTHILDAKINEEVARVAQTLQNDVNVAQARESELRRNMTELESSNSVQSAARVKLVELEGNAVSSRALYNNFLQRFKETQDQQDMQTPDSRLVAYGEVPIKPSFPRKALFLALAAPVSLFMGLLYAFALEQMNNGFRTISQVERALGNPAMSMVPELPQGKKERLELAAQDITAANYVLKKPLSSYSEAVRGLQMGLALNPEKKPTVLLVTSALPDEGKTTMAISLARQAAQSGQRVVLVDCDLRRSTVSDVMGLGPRNHWLADYLLGNCELEQVVAKDPQSSLRVIPALSNTPNAPALLASDRMQLLLATLRRSADLVIVDSPPLLPVNDTKTIVSLADAVLFVVRWEKTPREAAINAYRSLQELGARIGRVVLMRTDAHRFLYYNFGTDSYAYRSYYND